MNGSGNYLVGQGDRSTPVNLPPPTGSTQAPNLISRFDGASGAYLPAAFDVGRWYHLAIVRQSNQFSLFLNGRILNDSMSGSALTATNTNTPSGTLRLGRPGPTVLIGGRDAQFYGMMDELAVYTRAFTSAEIQAQFINRGHLTGNEPDLLAGWLFSPTPRPGLPTRMLRPVVRSGQTALVVNSANWSGSDMQLIPLPEHHTMELPFLPGEAWVCTQGFASGGSHSGSSAFCWDFQKADAGLTWADVYPNGSFRAPIYSTGDGEVTLVDNPIDPNIENQVKICASESIGTLDVYLLYNSALVSKGQRISGGRQVANICRDWHLLPNGSAPPHLHFGIIPDLVNQLVYVTAPAAFSNYEVRNALDLSWSVIPKGIPLFGQVVRRRRGWDNWHQLGVEQISSGPAVSSWGSGRLDVFARGTDNTLYTRSWDGNQWDNWHQLGVEKISSDPAAVSWASNRIDVFARGTDNTLYTKSWDGR